MSQLQEGDALADIGQRAIARIIDSALEVGALMALTVAFYVEGREVATAILAGIIIALYEVVPVVRRGATFGKQVMSISVVMAKDGSRPPVINAFLRVALAIPIILLLQQFFIVALVFLYSTGGYSKSRRGIVDRLAGTAVIKNPEWLRYSESATQ